VNKNCCVWLVLLLLPINFVLASDSIRLVVISDLNASYGSSHYAEPVHRAIKEIIKLEPDLVLISGDMVAGQRTVNLLNQMELINLWDAFERNIGEPLRSAGIALIAVAGNHDASGEARFQRERSEFQSYWKQYPPVLQPAAENTPLQWAWKLKNLTVIGLDATRHGPLKPAAQREWLKNTLAANQKKAGDIILVSGHLPIWAFAKGRETGILADTELEILLHEYRVDAYISGHHHAYYPGVHAGLVQISMGALGSGRRALIGNNNRSEHSFLVVDIGSDGALKYRALTGKHYQQVLDVKTLPAEISNAEVVLKRANVN